MADPKRLVELDEETCAALLSRHHFGRVAVDDGSGPIVLPVNYAVADDRIVFRTDVGTKLAAAARRATVAFQVDHVDDRRRLGWSVLVRGAMSEIESEAELARVRELPLDPFAGRDSARYVQIEMAAVTGRRIVVPDSFPEGWLAPSGDQDLWDRLEGTGIGWS